MPPPAMLVRRSRRVGVLDDGRGGSSKFADELPAGIEIHQIVVGELLAVKLFRARDARVPEA